MNMGYSTVQWLDRTFKTRAKTEELLRPELENGVITEHDYSLATNFLPGWHRYFPYTDGTAFTVLSAMYGTRFKRPPWPRSKVFIVASGAYIVGLGLDNRERFFEALENVNRRLGGDWARSRQRAPPADINGDASQPVEGDATWTAADPLQRDPVAVSGMPAAGEAPAAAPQGARTQQQKQQSQSRTRWDEIRAASARTTRTSSWDVLRQQHERSSNVDNVRPTPPSGDAGASDPDADRAQEQARFDAMLEAERKTAGS